MKCQHITLQEERQVPGTNKMVKRHRPEKDEKRDNELETYKAALRNHTITIDEFMNKVSLLSTEIILPRFYQLFARNPRFEQYVKKHSENGE